MKTKKVPSVLLWNNNLKCLFSYTVNSVCMNLPSPMRMEITISFWKHYNFVILGIKILNFILYWLESMREYSPYFLLFANFSFKNCYSIATCLKIWAMYKNSLKIWQSFVSGQIENILIIPMLSNLHKYKKNKTRCKQNFLRVWRVCGSKSRLLLSFYRLMAKSGKLLS